jgi:inosine-uridine nucleoside N-ribohydrolase
MQSVPIPILLDCDPGHDDAMAILLALASPELEVTALTTVAGNQTIEKVTANAVKVLDVAGAGHVPVGRGADRPLLGTLPVVASDVHGETGLDGPDLPPPSRGPERGHAVELLAAKLRERPHVLVATGPLTNVALLLALHPELEDRIERVVVMGGAIAEGNVTPAAEFNIWVDPEAAARVFGSGLDVTMVGLDVTHKALLTPAHAEALRATGRAGAVVADLLAFYLRFHEQIYAFDGAPVHDAMAVAQVIDPGLLTTEHRAVEIDTGSGPSRGRTLVDLWRRTGRDPGAHVAVDVDAARFLELLTSRIGSLP